MDSPGWLVRAGRVRRGTAMRMAALAVLVTLCALGAPLASTRDGGEDPAGDGARGARGPAGEAASPGGRQGAARGWFRAADGRRHAGGAPRGSLRWAYGRGGGGPAAVRVRRSLRYRSIGLAIMDVYLPARLRRASPALLVVHGGGWTRGDKHRMARVSLALARAGFVTFNLNYTLAAPWRPGFPRQVEELRAAVRWIRRNAARFRVDPARIGALGSSAGATLVGLLATDARGPLTAGARVRAAVTWSAPFDLTALERHRIAFVVDTFLGCRWHACPDREVAASPIAHVSPDDPSMLIVSSHRELIPATQAYGMEARLSSAGVPHRLLILDGFHHGVRYAPTVLPETVAFLRRRLR